jgi:acyl-CoA dehydrogenase
VYKTAWLIDKYFYAWARSLRIVDGPDAVHRRSIAREELKRERPFIG